MKTEKITINKTTERPDGIEIDVVHPENRLEEGVLCHLLAGYMRDAKKAGRVKYDLPDRLDIDYKGQGTFVVSADPTGAQASGMYVMPRPVAIAGIAKLGARYDVIHAEINSQQQKAAAAPTEAAPDNAMDTAEAPAEEPAEQQPSDQTPESDEEK